MRKPGQSRSLFPTLLHTSNAPVERPPQPPPTPDYPERDRAPHARTLWLALRFVDLALEARGARRDNAEPVAVISEHSGVLTVCAANAAAAALGVDTGTPLTAAYALAPQLITLERDEPREVARLHRLAAWCVQFTSTVSLEPPDTLLLDVQGSLTLFGGLPALLGQVEAQLDQLRIARSLSVAPTAQAALWFVRSAAPLVLDDAARLPDALSRLPLSVTGWPVRTLHTLAGMGVRGVGDVLRLPRDGFARRFGRQGRRELDRALGIGPEPRTPFVMPPVFEAALDLLTETERLTHIELAVGRLLDELAGVLRGHQRAVAQFRVGLTHRDATPTVIEIGLAAPSRDVARFKRVVHERLEALTLAAPVTDVTLTAPNLILLSGRDGDLFSRSVAGYEWPQLVETLRARLGAAAVHGLCLVPEHRPEAAWRYVEPGTPGASFDVPRRPLWMMSRPAPLRVHGQWPYWDGVLRIVRGPERIETGWWDGKDVARDYYIAVNPQQLYLWIYRRRRSPKDWYVHGVFA